MTMAATRPYRGVFPVVPTTFTENGELDMPSQLRCVDFMIDAENGFLQLDDNKPGLGLTLKTEFLDQFNITG
jgi:hypothetical protein